MGNRCQFKDNEKEETLIRCSLCYVGHHVKCVQDQKNETPLIWTCLACRTVAQDTKDFKEEFLKFAASLAKDIKDLKETQKQMSDSLWKITETYEAEKRTRLKTEERLAEVQSRLAELTQQLTNKELQMEGITPTPEAPHVTPSAPPLPNLLIGTSLLRNVDQNKLTNCDVKAKGGATIEEIHKELNDIPDSKVYNEITVVCGSTDLESKEISELILDFQALAVTATSKSEKITIASILPRTDKQLDQKRKLANEELKKMCAKDGHNFVDNDPFFHLMSGEVNCANLANDGLHLTKRGVDCLLQNVGVQLERSAYTPKRYSDPEGSNQLLFKGHKSPLSNFYPVLLKINGKHFKSAEAAYQYSKAETMGNKEAGKRILQAETALQAMKIASRIKTNERWLHKKFGVMENIIKEKIKVCPAARDILLNSGSKMIIEDTHHEFWGRGSSGQGKNLLGKIWMEFRTQLQENQDHSGSDSYTDKTKGSGRSDRRWATRSSQPRCYKCGETGHGMRQCWKTDAVSCWACGLTGHKQKHCSYFMTQDRRTTGNECTSNQGRNMRDRRSSY